MNYSVSNNAEYGEYVTGPRVVTGDTRHAMRQALKAIQTGEYAKSFILENRAGAPTLRSRRRLTAEHPIEQVGEKLRAMMPWIRQHRLVDQSRNRAGFAQGAGVTWGSRVGPCNRQACIVH